MRSEHLARNTTMAKKYRLTWSKQPNEQGLASVCQGPRGAILKLNGVVAGRVYANPHQYKGWYWVARHNTTEEVPWEVPLKNTCDTPVKELEDAKKACEAYVREVLMGTCSKIVTLYLKNW